MGQRQMTRRRRDWPVVVSVVLVLMLVAAACSAAETPSPEPLASPSESPSPTPIYCDDGPDAWTPMPADCVVPGSEGTPTSPIILPSAMETPSPRPTPASSLPTLPPTQAWHGRVLFESKGAGVRVIGVGPDDTVYAVVARPVPTPTPKVPTMMFIPDVKASVVALRPDGSPRPDWPSGGVPVPGFPYDYVVGLDGTVFVASGPNLFKGESYTLYQLTITAIGSDGKVLPGWPYRTPPTRFGLASQMLVPGPEGMLCYYSYKPGVSAPRSDTPGDVFCLGRDGKMLPGWPYEGQYGFRGRIAMGADGTVYVARITSPTSTPGTYSYPDEVVALGRDGKPKPGWQPWSSIDGDPVGIILPRPDGKVYVLLGADSNQARLVVLDANGTQLSDQVEASDLYVRPNYKDAKLTDSGALYVAVIEQNPSGAMVKAYAPDGSVMAGWPQPADHWPTVAVSPDGGWVWAVWVDYGVDGAHETSVVTLFDGQGRLQPGYPMASDPLVLLNGFGLYVDSNGTAYATAATKTGAAVVAFSR